MTSPAIKLARELSIFEQRLQAMERGSQLARSSVEVDGQTVRFVDNVRTATVALETANGKNTVTYSLVDATSATPGLAEGDIWWKVDAATGVVISAWQWTAGEWKTTTFGDAVLDSLTVGKLVTGEIAAGVRVIAGPSTGTHAEMNSDGFHVFREDLVDGVPDEAVRMGTQTNDYFGVASADGELVASIDDTGGVNGRTGNFREDIFVQGVSLADRLGVTSGGQVGRWAGLIPGLNGASGIRDEYGICQFTFPVVAGRSYLIRFDGPVFSTVDSASGGEVYLRVRTGQDSAVTLTSPELRIWTFSGLPDGRLQVPNRNAVYDATFTGTLHVGLTLQLALAPLSTSVVKVSNSHQVFMDAYDMGPSLPGTAGQVTAMGGQLYGGPPPTPPPAAVTQRDTGWMAPAGWRTFSGSGAERFDVPGPVQGWDPSGVNGDGAGFWFWNLPSITGTVDHVEVWLESLHWYFNSGGTARLAPIRGGAQYPVNNYKVAADYDVPGFPKPGSKIVDISGWKANFHNNQGANRAIGVSVGSIGNTNLAYYGRFNGTSARLRILYTQ